MANKNVALIKYEVKSCADCPFSRSETVHTLDPFEDVMKYKCNKKHGKIITNGIDWPSKPSIPNWCPIRKK